MLSSAFSTIWPKREFGSVADAMSVVAAPSCTSRTTMSASPLFDVAVAELVGDAVGGFDGTADRDVLDAGRADQRRELVGDGADEADA